MAGDWIKMRSNLWDDPRVSRLCDITDQSEAAIVGSLYWLWSAADQHSEDGVMPGLTLRSIDRKTGVQGFGAALVEVGWLADHPEGVRIVRFEEHNGASAKRRCSESRRKMSARDADKERTECGTLAEEPQQSCAPRVREEKEVNPMSSSLRSEDIPPLPAGKKKTFNAWLADAKAKGEKAISDYRPVWEYAERVGIPGDWIEIAWIKFRERYGADPNHKAKRYIDWRRVFLNAVEDNWFGLWWAKEGKFQLSTVGQQADIATREAA